MHKVNKIVFKNFKFFHNEKTTIDIQEKNLLLYGENGSGKSSIYWGLYTLFQSVYKEKGDVDAYFDIKGKRSLTNSFIEEGQESFVKLFLSDTGGDEKDSIISFEEVNTKDEERLVKLFAKYASFINFKSLFNHHNFLHREEIDLFPLFDYDILHSTDFGIKAESLEGNDFFNSDDVWSEIKAKKIFYYGAPDEEEVNQEEEERFGELINHFNENFEKYLEKIDKIIDSILKDDFGYSFKVKTGYDEIRPFRHPEDYTIALPPKISLRITDNGKPIHKPQSFLNEAKLTAIALAIKFAVVLEKYDGEKETDLPKLLVLDDIMISMDMGNRELITNLLLEKFKDFQIIFFTHDLNFYKYIGHKIDQKSKKNNWLYKEMHIDMDEKTSHEYPIIIDSLMTPFEKAKFYYKTKDFTTCSLYLRQAIEGKFKERLPKELFQRTDDKYTNLNTLWAILKARYVNIGIEKALDEAQISKFESSKLLILNPKAHHHKIELPVYKYEIDQIFDFIDYIDKLPIPHQTILLSKGMALYFQHPSINYSIEYKLTSDFTVDSIEKKKGVSFPKCKTIHWQFNNINFKHPDTGEVYTKEEVLDFKENSLIVRIQELCNCKSLKMDEDIFIQNTTIKNSSWKLDEVYIKNTPSEN